MLGRFLSLLLLFALITPALAMSGHCKVPAASPERTADMHLTSAVLHHREQRHEPKETERRDCVGCVLPGLGNVSVNKSPQASAVAGTVGYAAPMSSMAGQPDTPPPRG